MPCATVIADRWLTTPWPARRSRVVAVASGSSAASKTAQLPAMPKCTCTQTSSAPSPNHAKRFLPTASMPANSLPSMSAAPSAKRPFGLDAWNFLPTSLLRCRVATRCTLWPSTILIHAAAAAMELRKTARRRMVVFMRCNGRVARASVFRDAWSVLRDAWDLPRRVSCNN